MTLHATIGGGLKLVLDLPMARKFTQPVWQS